MKKSTLTRIAVALFAIVVSTSVQAVTIPLNRLIGDWDPASTLNNNTEATQGANILVNYYNSGIAPNPNTDPKFTLSANVLGVLPTPLTFGVKFDSPTPQAISNEYEYVLGKYGNVAYLFYVGGLAGTSFELPTVLNGVTQNALSHQLAFNAPRQSVPDGGSSLMLLGLALGGAGTLRRYFGK